MGKYDWVKLIVKLIAVIFIAVGAKGAAMLAIPQPPLMWKTLVFLEVIANVGNFLYGFFTDGLKSPLSSIIKPP